MERASTPSDQSLFVGSIAAVLLASVAFGLAVVLQKRRHAGFVRVRTNVELDVERI